MSDLAAANARATTDLHGRAREARIRAAATMQVAGVEMSLGSVAELARCLDRAGHWRAAMHVGFAIDRNRNQLPLTTAERKLISQMLEQCPASLLPLQEALERRA
jgi:hypothetical protein